jgi:hypothetical protein
MPSLTRLAGLARIGTLPETRRAIGAAARSETLRTIAHRAANDRGALARALRHPPDARVLLQSAVRHPATRELANAGLLFMPGRYLPLGWAAAWVADRLVRRYVDPPAGAGRQSVRRAGRGSLTATAP